jgi:GTP-binding protein
MSNIIAIVGRPNVGKSTLFNRLTGSRQAIVDASSGVTRDRHYGRSDWNGIEFSVIDTGGYVTGSDDVFETEIRKQVELAIDEADSILFMVDVKEGVTPLDDEVASMLRKSEKDVFLVVNKVDNTARMNDINEFYRFGFDKLYPISSINGSGTGELLDDVVTLFKPLSADETPDLPRYAVIGRPNVGKSSLINALIGEERNIVTPVPGTTRDTIYVHYRLYGFDFLLADTAGLRKKTKVHEDVEFYSVLRSIRSIESSDVCMLMIDATQGFESQDLNIFRLIEKNNKGVVILVNKWDLITKTTNTTKQFEDNIREKTAPFTDVPVVFTSVPNKQRIHKALDLCMQVYHNRERNIPTPELNDFLLPLIHDNPPPASKGKQIKIKYVTQLKTRHPAFVFFCNLPQYVKEPYKRFLENRIRSRFEFTGVPIQIYIRNK